MRVMEKNRWTRFGFIGISRMDWVRPKRWHLGYRGHYAKLPAMFPPIDYLCEFDVFVPGFQFVIRVYKSFRKKRA